MALVRLAPVVVALLAAWHRPAEACSCIRGGAEDHLARAENVFVGRALEELPADDDLFSNRRTRFAVGRVFKGDVAGEVTVETSQMSSACGFGRFRLGARYLVYAGALEDGVVHTGLCSGTHSLRDHWIWHSVAVAISLFPGAAAPGAGLWLSGDKRVGRRVMSVGLAGLALAGIAAYFSRDAPPWRLAVAPGLALWATSWVADIYGTSGAALVSGSSPRAPPRLDAALGYLFHRDPVRRDAHVATLDVTARAGRAVGRARGWLGDEVRTARGELGARLTRARDARVEAIAAASTRVDARAYELALRGRLEGRRLGAPLDGSFATGELGYAFDDRRHLLVAGSSFGVYLGGGGEAELYYRYRHDELAGDAPAPLPSQPLHGHVGFAVTTFRGPVGVTGTLEVGSTWIAGLGLRFRLE